MSPLGDADGSLKRLTRAGAGTTKWALEAGSIVELRPAAEYPVRFRNQLPVVWPGGYPTNLRIRCEDGWLPAAKSAGLLDGPVQELIAGGSRSPCGPWMDTPGRREIAPCRIALCIGSRQDRVSLSSATFQLMEASNFVVRLHKAQ
jgi:hypothetical protein